MNSIENHHPDKQNTPDYTIPLTRKQHQELHCIKVKDTPLFRKFQQYQMLVKLGVSQKNWCTAYQKEYNVSPSQFVNIKELNKEKRLFSKQLEQLIKYELPMNFKIRGLSTISIAGILAYAHPSRFPSQRKFLFYCGYTQASRKMRTKKGALRYNPSLKPILFNACMSLIKQKNPKYYPMYLKIKIDLRVKYPEVKSTHYIAINRLATLLLKEIYQTFKNGADKNDM